MIQDPWAECTSKTEFVFANEPTDDDLVDGKPVAGLDSPRSPDAVCATDEFGNDDD